MSERYEIRTLDDLVDLWGWLSSRQRETLIIDLMTWMNVSAGMTGKLGDLRDQVRMAFTWVDDGKNDLLGLSIRTPPPE